MRRSWTGPSRSSCGPHATTKGAALPLPAESIWDCVEVGRTTVEGLALSELLEVFPGRIDVLKADIEGAEVLALPTLGRADLARIGHTVEFHGARVFGFGLHRETRRTIRKLRRHGFVALNFTPDHRDVLLSIGECMTYQGQKRCVGKSVH